MHEARLPAWEATLELHADGGEPRDVLRQMVTVWVEQSVARRALIAVYARQHGRLNDATRQRIRAQHRELTDVWVELLGEIHPGLPVADRVTVVDSAMWLLRCPAFFRSELPDERVAQLLTTMIMGSLLIEQLDDRRGTIRRRVRQARRDVRRRRRRPTAARRRLG